MNYEKYVPYPVVNLKDRKWPNNVITKAPIWCSVDLRDGNQALITPMNLEKKIEFFEFLVKMGFKEIEIGFPAASETEFLFTRTLIEKDLIPDDVIIQVLTQSREHIIRKTFEAVEGAKKSIIHLYNSTSTLQREVVFDKNKDEIKEIALSGARMIKDLAKQYGEDNFIFEYSPESFTGTELDYAAEVCNGVIDVFCPTEEKKLIINLPATVEMSTPNIYADQIEYMCNSLIKRNSVTVSLHAHNDRGTAVAATELAIMAGADRVEGTIFGNGERTGNADILNLALNMYSQGIDPKLDFGNMDEIVEIYEESTDIRVHPRHPYAGELVYTAFSGSHQDAIKKGMKRMTSEKQYWEVPYLPVDPKDFGRSYDPIIRINSQSGKGGVSYILERDYGIIMPKNMQADFGRIVTEASDVSNKELLPEEIYKIFRENYVNYKTKLELVGFNEETNGESRIKCVVSLNGENRNFIGEGNGILDSFSKAVKEELKVEFEIINYNEHSLDYGTKSRAITYICIVGSNKKSYFGAGLSTSISKSSLKALVSAINKMLEDE